MRGPDFGFVSGPTHPELASWAPTGPSNPLLPGDLPMDQLLDLNVFTWDSGRFLEDDQE
jgi:hypothetical protein